MDKLMPKTQHGSQERILMTRRTSYQRGNVQLHNGEWTLRYREFNHAKREWTTKREKLGKFRDKKAARRAAEPIMVRVNERNNSSKPSEVLDITFRQFVEDRWRTYTAKLQPSSIDCYNSLMSNHLLPVFNDKRIRDVMPIDISDFLKNIRKTHSINTARLLYAMLRHIFGLAEQYDLIDKSPVRPKLHMPEAAKIDKPTLNVEQIGLIARNLKDEQEQLLALFIAVTGLRIGEALALRWMDFKGNELRINHTLYKGRLKQPKTESSIRPISLAPVIEKALWAHRDKSKFQAATDYIFCRPDGTPLSASLLRTHLYQAMDKSCIKRESRKFGFHIFRHTAGTLLYARSRDLKLVQGALGHSNISTTSDIYVHLGEAVVQEGALMLAEEILSKCDLTVTQKSEMVS